MGVSTDGILFFGFPLHGEEGYLDEADIVDTDKVKLWAEFDEEKSYPSFNIGYEDAWEEFYLDQAGLPKVHYSDPGWKEYFEKKNSLMKDKGGVIGHHCSDGFIMHYVALHSKNFSASRGYPLQFDPDEFIITEEDYSKLEEFCNVLGLVYDRELVGWYLASYWG